MQIFSKPVLHSLFDSISFSKYYFVYNKIVSVLLVSSEHCILIYIYIVICKLLLLNTYLSRYEIIIFNYFYIILILIIGSQIIGIHFCFLNPGIIIFSFEILRFIFCFNYNYFIIGYWTL